MLVGASQLSFEAGQRIRPPMASLLGRCCAMPTPGTTPLPDSDMTLFAVIEEAIRANGSPR